MNVMLFLLALLMWPLSATDGSLRGFICDAFVACFGENVL